MTVAAEMTCNHEYEFIPCMGTYCNKCSIAYGEACLHPDCNEMDCSKHFVGWRSTVHGSFNDIERMMTDDTYILYLAHDGVIEGKYEDVRRVLSHKSIKLVYFCVYYTADNVWDVYNEPAFAHIKFVPIY